MPWSSPKTWSSEPLTSADLNRYVRDNQNHIKDRLDNSISRIASGATSLTTSSTSFVDVDASRLSVSLRTHGGDILLGFTGTVRNSRDSGVVHFNIAVDGVDYIDDDGIISCQIASDNDTGNEKPLSFVMLIAGLSAGRHSFKLRWKTASSNVATMDIVDLHPQFWAKEI